MRYFSVLTVLSITMCFSSLWQNKSFAAITHSETAKKHAEGQVDTSIGEEVYERACAACHDAGIAGAIKFSDKPTWQKHIHHGIDHMVEAVIEGKGAMPARAGDPNLTDEEIEAAVNYIVDQTQ